MSGTRFGQTLTKGFTIAIVLALVVAGGIWWTLKDAGRNHLTAYFAGAVGLYEGNSVRMLGVDMGTVTKIQPMGNQVKVDFEYIGDWPTFSRSARINWRAQPSTRPRPTPSSATSRRETFASRPVMHTSPIRAGSRSSTTRAMKSRSGGRRKAGGR